MFCQPARAGRHGWNASSAQHQSVLYDTTLTDFGPPMKPFADAGQGLHRPFRRAANGFAPRHQVGLPELAGRRHRTMASEIRQSTRVCTENLIRVDDVMESPKLAE
jgi:hypothetical protein